jgi:hypothetical protein
VSFPEIRLAFQTFRHRGVRYEADRLSGVHREDGKNAFHHSCFHAADGLNKVYPPLADQLSV